MPVRVGLRYIDIWKDPLEDQIVRYEQEPIVPGQIVFYGPSYFTRWSSRFDNPNLRESILGKSGNPCCINRGFGSSCSEHQLYYYPRTVRPLSPEVLVYCPHGNYLSFNYTPEEAWELALRVLTYARTDFPGIRIYLCGSVPLASWKRNDPAGQAAAEVLEKLEKEYAENTPDCRFVDISAYAPLWQDELFVPDGVHFNARGYEVFAEFFKDALKEELEKF